MGLRIAVACGGTGGHVIPGLATAGVLRDRGHEVTLWLTGKDVESRSVGSWEGPTIQIPAEGFPSGVSLSALRAAWRMWRAARRCRRRMQENKPNVLMAMGSYASSGPVFAARGLRIPYVLHEANVLPGRAISLLARGATAVACSFEETRHYLPGRDLVVTGMPLRQSLDPSRHETYEELPGRDRFTLLVMGGSAGAHAINEAASSAVCRVAGNGQALQVIHLTGVNDEAQVRERYAAAGVPAAVHAFSSDMAAIYRSADLAICRAGASTCAELSAFGVPALLVPYPYAAKDHQTVNARALEKIGAADVVPEHDVSDEWLVDYVTGCMGNPQRLARMSARMRARSPGSAAERLAELVEKVATAS